MREVEQKCKCGMSIKWEIAWEKGMKEVTCLCKRVWRLQLMKEIKDNCNPSHHQPTRNPIANTHGHTDN